MTWKRNDIIEVVFSSVMFAFGSAGLYGFWLYVEKFGASGIELVSNGSLIIALMLALPGTLIFRARRQTVWTLSILLVLIAAIIKVLLHFLK
ncbi:MAG: hypothetical protein P4L73_03240 [Caulobacteraceae bacterium]|nr:hypothetical protein [Caulobacteraceae bacterium]